MAKTKTVYHCNECGAQYPKWQGQCRECGAWNSLSEEIVAPKSKKQRGWQDENKGLTSFKLNNPIPQNQAQRHSTSYQEMDRVLGGGLVLGSYTLIGGNPGIGKSTLLLQICGGLAKNNLKVLYVSGEESVEQTALRAQRLNVRHENIEVATESRLENIVLLAKQKQPDILIVDSIQTMYTQEISSAPGTVSQVRECASHLMGLAKGSGISVFIVGHVTKDGNIAGPKVLEHMVDTVLSFEGDNSHHFRLLRAIKNRFGATNELGVFQMDSGGLREVTNPSELFLEERGHELIGSSVFSAMEGSRPLLCEVQCLTTYTPMAMPRRTSIGFDTNRVHLLIAVLNKHLDLELSKSDVFVNVVGGLKIQEPAADMAVAAALISSEGQQEINAKACFFGEIGLTGEVRAVSFAEDRVKEAKKLGFEYFVMPASNKKHVKNLSGNFLWIKHVNDLEKVLFKLQQKITSSIKAPTQPEAQA